jgi:hypothetical protein
MTFKKTITFTARVSDYTAGTVSARVQAENKILSDLVTFILAQGLNIQQVEKVAIGDAMWSGAPMNATTGATSLVYNDSLLSDVYFLGKGMTKKCLGLSVDNNILYAGFTDTATHDMTFTQSSGEWYGRLPTNQLRYLKTTDDANRRKQCAGAIELAAFSTTDDELSLTIAYYKGTGSLIIKRTDGDRSALVLFADPASVLLYGGTAASALHFSLNDDITIDASTYTDTASNTEYAANTAKQYGMSLNPAYIHGANTSCWERNPSDATAITMHTIGNLDLPALNYRAANPANGMTTAASTPAASLYGFPRIKNDELYIKKMYIPMTYPAIASPVKVGYTPGILYAGTVYQLNGKYYLSITQGVIGYFIEVADQGA